MPNAGKVPLKESNNFKQGRSGSGAKKISGPVGGVKKNPMMGGGINRPTKS